MAGRAQSTGTRAKARARSNACACVCACACQRRLRRRRSGTWGANSGANASGCCRGGGGTGTGWCRGRDWSRGVVRLGPGPGPGPTTTRASMGAGAGVQPLLGPTNGPNPRNAFVSVLRPGVELAREPDQAPQDGARAPKATSVSQVQLFHPGRADSPTPLQEHPPH